MASAAIRDRDWGLYVGTGAYLAVGVFVLFWLKYGRSAYSRFTAPLVWPSLVI